MPPGSDCPQICAGIVGDGRLALSLGLRRRPVGAAEWGKTPSLRIIVPHGRLERQGGEPGPILGPLGGALLEIAYVSQDEACLLNEDFDPSQSTFVPPGSDCPQICAGIVGDGRLALSLGLRRRPVGAAEWGKTPSLQIIVPHGRRERQGGEPGPILGPLGVALLEIAYVSQDEACLLNEDFDPSQSTFVPPGSDCPQICAGIVGDGRFHRAFDDAPSVRRNVAKRRSRPRRFGSSCHMGAASDKAVSPANLGAPWGCPS